MIDQVSNEQIEIFEDGNADLFKASALGFGLVSGYIIAGFATLAYLLWMITNIYLLLIGDSIINAILSYTSIWIGLLLTIVFLAINILVIAGVIYLVKLITKAFKGKD
jgi:hypothetical protein